MKYVLTLLFFVLTITVNAQTDPLRVGLLFFPPGSSELTPKTKEKLAGLRLAMLAYPEEIVFLLTTQSKLKGQEEVAFDRWEAVINYMKKTYGFDRTRFQVSIQEEGEKDVVLFRLLRVLKGEEGPTCIPLPFPTRHD